MIQITTERSVAKGRAYQGVSVIACVSRMNRCELVYITLWLKPLRSSDLHPWSSFTKLHERYDFGSELRVWYSNIYKIISAFSALIWGGWGLFHTAAQIRCSLAWFLVDMFAVIGRGLFYEVAPTRFGNLGKAFFTLFQLITLDDWFYMYSDVVAESPGQIFILRSRCVIN